MRTPLIVPAIAALALVASACGDDAPNGTGTDDPAPIQEANEAGDAPTTGPATIAADDQAGDGNSVTVSSVSLPTAGFVVIHGDSGSGPGAILGWSDSLPAGDSSDVVVELRQPLTESGMVYPMAHVDANGNGAYEFMPPEVTIDVPATTADGGVAVLAIAYALQGEANDGESAAGIVLEVASTDDGDIVVDADGRTLYLFVPDERGDSTCYDTCESNWPIVPAVTAVGDGVDASLLGSTTRTNGDVQATYNGWPLYYFAGDAAPGDANGQGLNDVWWLVDTAGDAVGS